jgi:hypothetical protein
MRAAKAGLITGGPEIEASFVAAEALELKPPHAARAAAAAKQVTIDRRPLTRVYPQIEDVIGLALVRCCRLAERSAESTFDAPEHSLSSGDV